MATGNEMRLKTMRLKTITYRQFEGTAREWSLSGLDLKPTNLVVGKNTSGKSRTLTLINTLGKLVSGALPPEQLATACYNTLFEHEGRSVRYSLTIRDHRVASEEFRREDEVLLTRGAAGGGQILHEREGKRIDFQPPETQLAVVARRDTIQHSFLAPLAEWGAGVRHYAFGEKMGNPTITLRVPYPTDVNAVVALFLRGAKHFPDAFKNAVLRDMNAVAYELTDIGVMSPTDLRIEAPPEMSVTPAILFVREKDLPGVTEQTDMSQGMFRALSVIIHLNYAQFAALPTCIVIDDIGEGLDFDRSCRLIDMVRSKALGSSVQLLMATNDRFVMNKVPLEDWSVLQRRGGAVTVRNYGNSKAVFDEFRFTGLNNFDFLATDFMAQDPKSPARGASDDAEDGACQAR
jgi:hypothetical protein